MGSVDELAKAADANALPSLVFGVEYGTGTRMLSRLHGDYLSGVDSDKMNTHLREREMGGCCRCSTCSLGGLM